MDERHRHRARVTKPTIEMTARVFNGIAREAEKLLEDPKFMVTHHDWLKAEYGGSDSLHENLTQHADEIQRTFESALAHAVFGVVPEQLGKKKGDASIFMDFTAPENVGALQASLVRSVGYASDRLDAIKGLAPESKVYCMNLYVDLQDHMYALAEEILSKPKVRGL